MTQTRLAGLLDTVIAEGGSDIHLSVGTNPIVRISGALVPLLQEKPLTGEETKTILKSILPEARWQKFETDQTVDFSYSHTDGSRFRVNGYIVQGNVTVAMRLIPKVIRTFADLNLPPVLE